MRKLQLRIKIFFICIYIITILSLFHFIYTSYIPLRIGGFAEIFCFSLLTALTESLTISFKNVSFSTTFSITLASYILFGPLSAIIIICIGFSLRILKLEEGKYHHLLNTPFYGTFFNYCVLIFPIVVANHFYISYGGYLEVNIFQII